MISKGEANEAYYNLCGFAGTLRDYCIENDCKNCIFYITKEDKCSIGGILEPKGDCLK